MTDSSVGTPHDEAAAVASDGKITAEIKTTSRREGEETRARVQESIAFTTTGSGKRIREERRVGRGQVWGC